MLHKYFHLYFGNIVYALKDWRTSFNHFSFQFSNNSKVKVF